MLDRDHLGVLDILAQRNAFGRQLRSFEADLESRGHRAARCTPCSSARRGWPSAVTGSRCWPRSTATRSRSGRATCVAVAFHPELAGETRLHELLLELAARSRAVAAEPAGSAGGCAASAVAELALERAPSRTAAPRRARWRRLVDGSVVAGRILLSRGRATARRRAPRSRFPPRTRARRAAGWCVSDGQRADRVEHRARRPRAGADSAAGTDWRGARAQALTTIATARTTANTSFQATDGDTTIPPQ